LAIKILITGAAGQVGRELVDLCQIRGIPYISYTSTQLDITKESAVMYAIEKDMPTHVINAAAYTAVDKAEIEQEQAFAVNKVGVENLAKACKRINAKLIHISTDYVFDGEKPQPYTTADMTHPTSVYGLSKLAGEQAIANVFDNYFILRVSWVFGQYGNNFVKTMLRLAETRRAISVVNDQYGAPTPAVDIAQCLLQEAVLHAFNGVEHLESSPGMTWHQFAETIFTLAGKDINVQAISSAEYPTPVKRPKNSKLASSRLPIIEWQNALDTLLRSKAFEDKQIEK